MQQQMEPTTKRQNQMREKDEKIVNLKSNINIAESNHNKLEGTQNRMGRRAL